MNDRRKSDYSGRGNRDRDKRSRIRRVLFPLLIIVVAGLLYYRHLSVRQVGDAEWQPPRGLSESQSTTGQPSWPVRQVNPMPASTQPPERFNTNSQIDDGVVDVSVIIDTRFRPVSYKMAATSHRLQLSEQPPQEATYLPEFKGYKQRFGTLVLNDQKYLLALDADINGYRLFVDINGNGDFSDDGEPLLNVGSGLFASTLRLPLSEVTGMDWMQGDYVLWIYAGNKERPPASLSYYARTQLQGSVQLPFGRYDMYLADNRQLDGDYSNDGISLDLNRDGRIELMDEHIPPDNSVTIDGTRYRIKVSF